MDEKTQELRDIFLEMSGEGSVTESQEQTRGSLADDRSDEERVGPVIETMHERLEFETDEETETYAAVVRGFFADESDEEIAERIEVDADRVLAMRMDLHLVREADTEAAVETRDIRRRRADGESVSEIADALDVAPEELEGVVRALEAEAASRRVNDRYRDEFEAIVADGDLSTRLAHDAREDGLREATEGMENELSM
ncbi:hypothetical protein [Natronorarus salvus]|uniref:hypothetical protein n=1 Tax=Natronorarus salvus TaxID=3117733 RepID=UPI002F25F0C8